MVNAGVVGVFSSLNDDGLLVALVFFVCRGPFLLGQKFKESDVGGAVRPSDGFLNDWMLSR